VEKKLPAKKRQEYDNICNEIQELSQEFDRLIKEQKDTTEIHKRLGIVLDTCLEFVRREFYNNGK